ncbi:MAG: GNAT family N-acetyltransferase [Methylovulum sp.]|nr:GNAT family N-acetyltransferase [Methylovulum sp.]
MTSYTVITGYENMDMKAVHAFLSTTHWFQNVPFDVVDSAAGNSLCFGIFAEQEQVAFGRVITDKATFAYLADVYVIDAHRNQGLSKRLLDAIFQHPELQCLRRFMLITRDAHTLYAKYGFTPSATPSRIMEIYKPDIYLSPVQNGQ